MTDESILAARVEELERLAHMTEERARRAESARDALVVSNSKAAGQILAAQREMLALEVKLSRARTALALVVIGGGIVAGGAAIVFMYITGH